MTYDVPSRGDMDPHVDQLTDLATRARIILEIGVGSFASTMALMRGLPDDGHLTSVDIDFKSHPELDADPRWSFIHGSSMDPATIVRLPREPDLMFIDSGHSLELTWLELLLADFLRAKRIALHDYLFPVNGENCRVHQAVDEFLEAGTYRWEALHESYWGLAVLVRA